MLCECCGHTVANRGDGKKLCPHCEYRNKPCCSGRTRNAESFEATNLRSRKETEKRFGKDLAKYVHTLSMGAKVEPSHFCECGNELTIYPRWDVAESHKLGKESLMAECEKCGWTGVVQRAAAAETFDTEGKICSGCQIYGYWDDRQPCPMCRGEYDAETIYGTDRKVELDKSIYSRETPSGTIPSWATQSLLVDALVAVTGLGLGFFGIREWKKRA